MKTQLVTLCRLGLLTLMLSLTACESIREIPEQPVDERALNAQIRELEQQQQYVQAADLLIQLSEQAPSPQREQLLLQAATNLIQANQLDRATALLNNIASASQDKQILLQVQHLRVHMLLNRGQPEKALATMPALPVDASLTARIMHYRLTARAYFMMGNILEGVRQLLAVDSLIDDNDTARDIHTRIWNQLMQLTPIAMTQLATEPPPDIMSGWLELASIAKTVLGDAAAFDAAIAEWRLRYPQHPANRFILEQVLLQHSELKRPEKLALLLPLSGKLAKPASAIRDGFLAAHYAQPEFHGRTRIRFYDTQQPNQTIEAIYQQAVDDGAEFIIGPLDKQKVSRLAVSQNLTVPVLSLNQTDGLHAAQENLFQFGLIPEDEARQVAERTHLAGLMRAVIIAPQGEWGNRMTEAFSRRFEQLGGTVLEEVRYQFGSSDFSGPIKRLLNLDESERRYQRLRNALPSLIKFEPRRRQDIDFVFMAAFPRQARLIAPQLRFHHAADVPVYTTSHAYNATERVQENQDMNGVIVCDSSWILQPDAQRHPLRHSVETIWPDRLQGYARLFALGIDAYQLLPRIRWLYNHPGEHYQGATGHLTLDADKTIRRALKWGQFENGRIQLLNDLRAEPIPEQPPAAEQPQMTQ